MEKNSLIPEDRVRAAMSYQCRALTNLYNVYGAGGAWGGAPIPLTEISRILDNTELLLQKGLEEAVEELKQKRKEQDEPHD